MASPPHRAPPRVKELLRVGRRLAAAYGRPARRSTGPALDQLVATILSQHTSDANSAAAFRALQDAWPDWNAVADAPLPAIERVIRTGGLARAKARTLRGALRTIRARESRMDLGRLQALTDREALAYLTALPGVGLKTASCVLLFALGRPVVPVDTHVHRVTRRLGWFRERTSPDAVCAALSARVPSSWALPLHRLLVRHGREVCRARHPGCDTCILAACCPTAGS